jgi:hypothetical protein
MYIDIDYDNQLYNNIFHKIFRTMSVSHLGSSWSYGGEYKVYMLFWMEKKVFKIYQNYLKII